MLVAIQEVSQGIGRDAIEQGSYRILELKFNFAGKLVGTEVDDVSIALVSFGRKRRGVIDEGMCQVLIIVLEKGATVTTSATGGYVTLCAAT